jgi:signal transduction histidine kinase
LLQIRFSRENRKLVIEIEDDGVGRSKAKERNIAGGHEHQGLTTIVTRERLEKMGNRWRGRGKLEIFDLLNEDGSGRGTLLRIIIPEIN